MTDCPPLNITKSKFVAKTLIFYQNRIKTLDSIFLILFLFFLYFVAVSEDPEFTDIIENITVTQGRNVILKCSVRNLGPFKVSPVRDRS